jgi:hypothetical protein
MVSALDELRVRLPVSVSRTVDDIPVTNAIARLSDRSGLKRAKYLL